VKATGLLSVATAALVASIAGMGGALPIVLAATQAVGATPEQTDQRGKDAARLGAIDRLDRGARIVARVRAHQLAPARASTA
jgi:hypothetical protein